MLPVKDIEITQMCIYRNIRIIMKRNFKQCWFIISPILTKGHSPLFLTL